MSKSRDAVEDIRTIDTVTATANAALPKAGGALTGTVTNFTSTGIDDNATSTAVTIDANENVGIGTSNVDSMLHLTKSDVTAYSATATDGQVGVGPTIYLENPANSNTTIGGQIVFGSRSTEAQARIGATGGANPTLTFGTNDAERMRIDSSGRVLVGISGASGFASLESNDIAITGQCILARGSGSVLVGTTTAGSAGAGDIVVAGGVYLGGTGAANKLDDYEEGTWTPTLNFGGNTTGMAFTTQSGSYVKVGQVVTAQFRIELSAKGSSTGNANFGGLPFNATSVGTLYPAFYGLHHDVNSGSGNTTANVLPIGQIARSTTTWNYYQADSTTAVTDAYFNNNTVINGTVTFRVN